MDKIKIFPISLKQPKLQKKIDKLHLMKNLKHVAGDGGINVNSQHSRA